MNEHPLFSSDGGLADSILGPFMVLGLTIIATYVGIGFLRVHLRKTKERAERRAERMAAAPDRYISGAPRRVLQLAKMVQADPSFQIGQGLNWVRSLHMSTHKARAHHEWGALNAYLSEGAREILGHDAPNLERIGEILYSRCRFTAIHANTASTGFRVQLHSYTVEQRNGAEQVWEFEDVWSLTRMGDAWRVLSAERILRQPLQPPSIDREAPPTPDSEIRHDPELAIQREHYLKENDLKATEFWLKETYRLLYEALQRQDLSDVAARLSPIASMEASAAIFRFEHFGLKSVRDIETIGSIQLVQCTQDAQLSRAVFRISARVSEHIERSDGALYGTKAQSAYPIHEYWTVVKSSDGTLLVDWIDSDTDWLI